MPITAARYLPGTMYVMLSCVQSILGMFLCPYDHKLRNAPLKIFTQGPCRRSCDDSNGLPYTSVQSETMYCCTVLVLVVLVWTQDVVSPCSPSPRRFLSPAATRDTWCSGCTPTPKRQHRQHPRKPPGETQFGDRGCRLDITGEIRPPRMRFGNHGGFG